MSADQEFPRVAIPLGWLARGVTRARRSYLGGRGERAGAPVISVGNLAVGGTGKTPLVRQVALWLEEAGVPPAVLSRGYARPETSGGVTRVSRAGRLETLRWELAGDEPWMLARSLPRTSVYVGAARAECARAAVRDGARVLVLDDGFQHLALARDLDVVCLRGDERDLRLLPAGPLREAPSALRAAGAGVWVHVPAEFAGDDAPGADQAARVRECLAPGAVWAEAEFSPRALLEPGGPVSEPGSLRGRRIGVLCAVARPERFSHMLAALGGRIEAIHVRADHHVFGGVELDDLRRDLLWVTTEKDAVRLPRDFPAAVLTMELRFTAGGEALHERVLQVARGPIPGPQGSSA